MTAEGPLLGRSATSRLHLIDPDSIVNRESTGTVHALAACNRTLVLDDDRATLALGFEVLCLKCARAVGRAVSDTTERTAP